MSIKGNLFPVPECERSCKSKPRGLRVSGDLSPSVCLGGSGPGKGALDTPAP